ncbi:reverse transcriptase domain-containing protein [Tanacetum coccineum]
MQNYNNTASTSRSGTLPSQTVTNHHEHVNAITTRSGKTYEGPSTPLVPTPVVSTPSKEPERNLETSMDKVQKPSLESTAQVPPPEDEDSIFIEIPKPKAKKTVNRTINHTTQAQSKLAFLKNVFKQLRLEIGLKDALVEMPKFNECSPRKPKNPRKFLIPCALQELNRTSALADSGASINLLPHSIYKQLGLEALTLTRMTLELANRSISHPMGIAEDVVVRVDGFTFLTDFVMVNFEPDPRDTSDNLEEFADELTLLKKDIQEGNFQDHSNPLFEFDDNFKSSTVNPLFNKIDEEVVNVNSNVSDSDESVLLNTPLSNKVECSTPEDDIDEIDAFLAIEVSSKFEEGYFDSEGDVTFLDNLLSDDTTHNLASEVISDHEPEQNESSITFSPRSDPLHHEFAGEVITLPSRNDREFGEYLSLMTVLCEISTSQLQENVHQSSIIESLSVSPIPVEDSEPVQEEIDIFLVPDDLIPPSVENDDFESEDEELSNFDYQDDPSIPRPPPEPPDVEKCFEPEAVILITKVFKGVSKPHDFMIVILPTLVSDLTFILFLPLFFSFGSEDAIFDPGIVTFHEPVTFSMEVSFSKCCSP